MKQVNFGKIKSPIDPPLLLGMQKDSFADFMQRDVEPENRKAQGLEGAFRDVFPIKNSDESLEVQYISYSFGEPKYSVTESVEETSIFAASASLKVSSYP